MVSDNKDQLQLRVNGQPVIDSTSEGFASKVTSSSRRKPADEAIYGLGQHQEGIFNVRGVPIRLSQANTNISIPFLLSSKGYGILWMPV